MNKKVAVVFLAFFAVCLFSPLAFAGEGGTPAGSEFNSLYEYIKGITTGTLGRTIAISAVALGAIISVARVNPIPALSGIGFAIFEYYTPNIIDGIMGGMI